MVNVKLYKVLDELKELLDWLCVAPDMLYSWLYMRNYFTREEIYIIENNGIPTSQINVFCDMLKAKPDKVFEEIYQLANHNGWSEVCHFIKFRLKEMNFENILNLHKQNLNVVDEENKQEEHSSCMPKIIRHLKSTLSNDIEEISKYWEKLGTHNHLESFYNSDLIIIDNFGRKLNSDNFDSLFEGIKENCRYKRIVISAPAGYGKSTFVHEMVRQWTDDCQWAKRFVLVFLIRLGEIRFIKDCNEKNPLSLKRLFEMCLKDKDAQIILDSLDKELWSRTLLVFDGFDELERNLISDEVYDLIVGRSKYTPYVIVTCRPNSCFENLHTECNRYIELKGYTETGISKQWKKFSGSNELPLIELPFYIPLFMTLFGIILNDYTKISSTWSLIHKVVRYLIRQYQTREPAFSVYENKMLTILGQAAQAEYAFVRPFEKDKKFEELKYGNIVLMPNFYSSQNSLLLHAAKSAHLVLPSSLERVYFPHDLFAAYFAAYYWSKQTYQSYFSFKNFTSEINSLELNVVSFTYQNCCCDSTSWFSLFLSYFNPDYKVNLWKKLETLKSNSTVHSISIPFFEEYKNLPNIQINASSASFSALSGDKVSDAMNKMKFPRSIEIRSVCFDKTILHSDFTNVQNLRLSNCTISWVDFIAKSKITSLNLSYCTFKKLPITSMKHAILRHITIISPNGDISSFLNETVNMSNSIRSLYLTGIPNSDWINSLTNKNIMQADFGYGEIKFSAKNMTDAIQNVKKAYESKKNTTEHIYFSCIFV